jgi:hypothetical protein
LFLLAKMMATLLRIGRGVAITEVDGTKLSGKFGGMFDDVTALRQAQGCRKGRGAFALEDWRTSFPLTFQQES